MFIFVHFLLSSLVIATLAYLLIGRLLGPGGKGLPPRMRRRGLFSEEGGGRDGEAENLEFGYCFDVSGIREAIYYIITPFRRTANGIYLTRSLSAPFSLSGSVYMSDSSCCGISLEAITGTPWSFPSSVQRSPDGSSRISLFLGNTLYLVAFSYYIVIFFLGYNGMSSILLRMLFPLYQSVVKKIS